MESVTFPYTRLMVKNIIFDIGNVLATFQPRDFLYELFHDDQIVDCFFDVFFQELWHKYDQGLYSLEDMISLGIKELPNYENEIRFMMNEWVNYVRPIDSSMQIIKTYKEKGYHLFILSNIPEDSYLYLKNNFDFIQKMDGGIYSYQDLLIKPDKRIYELLLMRYSLNANESLFIDDKLENIEAASSLGFQTIHCTDYHELPRKIEEKLNEM